MKKKIRKIIIVAVAVIVAAGAGAYYMSGSGIPVSTFAAERGAIEKLIIETGNVEAANSVTVSGKIQGQLFAVDVKEGDAVTEGQRIALYTDDNTGSVVAADIDSLRAQIAGLRIQANQASDLAAKNRQLYEQGAMSYEEYNQSDTAARQLASQIASLEHTIVSRSESVGSRELVSPISGTVTSVMVNEGEIVSPGSPIVEISDISKVYINVDLISEDADEVTEGDKVRVTSESNALIDDAASVSKIFVKAREIMSDLGIIQKRVPVEVTLSGGKSLRLGSSVNVEIIVDERQNALRIPDNAIFELNREPHVFVAEDGKAVLRAIETGLEGEDFTEILSGLSEGELIITSPAREIGDGVSVKAD
jgi:HlyD family secretion protein